MSAEQFPITAAQLAGSFCESLFYGIYLVTCGFCARSLLFTGSGYEARWLRMNEIRWMMVVISSLLFVICTFNLSTGLLHNIRAFVQSDNPEKEFLNPGDWINVARSCTVALSVLIGGIVLVYRCWIVYGHRWLIVIPSITLWFAAVAMGVMFVEAQWSPNTNKASTVGGNPALRWALALCAIAAAQTTLTSGILIWRIWRVEKECERHYNFGGSGSRMCQSSQLGKVIRVIAESGTANTTMVLITFFAGLSKSNAVYPTSAIALITAGISFNVIIIRATANRDQQFSTRFDSRATMPEFNMINETTTSGSIGCIPDHIIQPKTDARLTTVKTDFGVETSPTP